jgi:hypothetical protein
MIWNASASLRLSRRMGRDGGFRAFRDVWTMPMLGVEVSGCVSGTYRAVYVGAAFRLKAMASCLNSVASGHALATLMRMRVTVSTMRAAILINRFRRVVNSATLSGALSGMAFWSVHMSQ